MKATIKDRLMLPVRFHKGTYWDRNPITAEEITEAVSTLIQLGRIDLNDILDVIKCNRTHNTGEQYALGR